jgi:3-phosphoshikimate 1-carboxyvinyltransferase
MKRLIKPSGVKGSIQAPASKSAAQRAIAIASLAKGRSEILYPGDSDDAISAIRVCRSFGVNISEQTNILIIEGGIKKPERELNCGESGLGIRMFSALAAILEYPITLTGTGSLVKRPMDVLENSMRALGVECTTNSGYLPITLRGPVPGGEVWIDGSYSSQVLTGILIASPFARKDLTLHIMNLQSKPYVDLTISIMRDFGVEVKNENYEVFSVKKDQKYVPGKFIVEGDWSGAAFMLVAAAVAGKVEVKNLLIDSLQADRAILNVLELAGAEIHIGASSVLVGRKELKAFEFDATDCPDLFPPLVALAVSCKGVSLIKGVRRLKGKESDRGITLQQEFGKLGAEIILDGDTMKVRGCELHGGMVHSHEDHRIAMALAIAGLRAKGVIEIEGAEAINKSYPEFFEDMERLMK